MNNENGELVFGTVAMYGCNTGFSLVGNNNRTCTGDGSSTTGSFNGVAPICEGSYILIFNIFSY